MQPQRNDSDLFDALIVMRELYGRRGPLDRDAGLSVAAVVVYGEGLMRIARRRDQFAARRKSATNE